LPFLDAELLRWDGGVPLRVAGLTVPVGLQRLYFIGLAAPRGPQLPVYSRQARLVARLLRLTERGGSLAGAFDGQAPDKRIDIVRPVWNDQMRATEKLVGALEKSLEKAS